MTTVSAAPVASITVNRAKPGPRRIHQMLTVAVDFAHRHAVDQHGHRQPVATAED